MTTKIQKPCYFYNTGGCYNADGSEKTELECKYLHIKVNEPLEKPQHLKPPCKYYHLRRHCKNPYCAFGHSELSEERWKKYFKTHPFPGINYSDIGNYVWDEQVIEPNSNSNINQVKISILMLMLQLLEDIPQKF